MEDGARSLAMYLDGMLIYTGELACGREEHERHKAGEEPIDTRQTILFSDDSTLAQEERSAIQRLYGAREDTQNVAFINDGKVLSGRDICR